MPAAGGTYVYLQEAFGPAYWGRLFSFVFVCGAALVMPLVAASVAVSFAQYALYLWPGMTSTEARLLAGGACLLATGLLYRDIRSVGRLSTAIFVMIVAATGWIIVTGIWHFDANKAFDFPPGAFSPSISFVSGLGTATLIALLDYGGYGTVCLCGAEVKNPQRTIPRSIIYAVLLVAAFYSLTTLSVIGVIPWREAVQSPFVVSDFIRRLHGSAAATMFTIVILVLAFGSLFTSLLGFSRVLYGAAAGGQFFSSFARVHPTKRFPSVSVVGIGLLSSLFCVLPLDTLIKVIMGVGVVTQNIPQVIALVVIRRRRKHIALPFRMWAYPLPAIIALVGFFFVLFSNERSIILFAIGFMLLCSAVYIARTPLTSAQISYARNADPNDENNEGV
jgi:amino acid transporter